MFTFHYSLQWLLPPTLDPPSSSNAVCPAYQGQLSAHFPPTAVFQRGHWNPWEASDLVWGHHHCCQQQSQCSHWQLRHLSHLWPSLQVATAAVQTFFESQLPYSEYSDEGTVGTQTNKNLSNNAMQISEKLTNHHSAKSEGNRLWIKSYNWRISFNA